MLPYTGTKCIYEVLIENRRKFCTSLQFLLFFLKKVSRKRKILLIVKGEISEIFEILKSRKFEINLINPLESKKFVFTSN